MSLSKPRTIFGVHSVTPYNITTKIPYGMARVVQGSTFALEGKTIELKGGSNRFSWQIEDGDIEASLAFSVSEYPNWLFQLFGGKAPTEGSAEASGNLGTITDVVGTSVVAATGLLATATVTTAANLKLARIILKATAADALAIYAVSDVDFGRGADAEFTNDALLIDTWTGITTGATHLIPNFGITLTAGASATAMTVDDVAYFDVRPVNTFNRLVKIGGIADEFPEFGCMIYAQKSGSGAVFVDRREDPEGRPEPRRQNVYHAVVFLPLVDPLQYPPPRRREPDYQAGAAEKYRLRPRRALPAVDAGHIRLVHA